MPGTPTTRMAIPLPAGGDEVAVPADLRAAAERIDLLGAIDDQGSFSAMPAAAPARRGMYWWATDRKAVYRCDGAAWWLVAIDIARVTSLPSSPFDGQTVDFVFPVLPAAQSSYKNSPVWRFVYRSGASGPYKWEFVGGGAAHASSGDSEYTFSSIGATPIGSMAIVLPPPLVGEFLLTCSGSVEAPSGGDGLLVVAGNNGTASLANRFARSSNAQGIDYGSRTVRLTVDSNTGSPVELPIFGWAVSGGVQIKAGALTLSLVPVRVG